VEVLIAFDADVEVVDVMAIVALLVYDTELWDPMVDTYSCVINDESLI
jgi:hypothetical protein